MKCHLKLHTDITLHYRPGLHTNAAKVYRLNHRHVVSDFSDMHMHVMYMHVAFSALTLLVGRQEGHPACKKNFEWWGTSVVICLERGADLHMVQLMPLPLAVSCFSKIQIGFSFLVPADPGSPGKRAVKRVCVCVCVYACRLAFRPKSKCFVFMYIRSQRIRLANTLQLKTDTIYLSSSCCCCCC